MDSSNTPEKPRWRFDPSTGQPIGDNALPEAAPSEGFRVEPPTQVSPPQSYGAQPTQPVPQYQPAPEPQQPQYNYAPPSEPVQVAPTPPPPAKKSSRTPLIVGAVAIVLLAVLGGGGFYLYQNFINKPAVSVERLLPPNTLGYFTFDPVLEGSQKEAMDKLGAAFQEQPGFKDAWAKLTSQATDMLGEAGSIATPDPANLDTLATYLGNNVTIALLPPSSDDLDKLKNSSEGDDPEAAVTDILGRNVVGIVDLDFNPLNKKGPISDLKQQADNAGKAELVEKYRDIEIRKFVTNTTEIYFALLDNSSTALVGAKADPLKTVINQYKDNKTLKDDATFKALSGQVPADRIAALYINLTEIYKQAQFVMPELSAEGGTVQSANGAMLLTLSAANDGMQLDIASEADLSVMNSGVQINPSAKPDEATLRDVPVGSLGFFAGTDLESVLKGTLESLRKDPNMSEEINRSLADFQQQFGIDPEQEVLPLLGGDYVLSVSYDDKSGDKAPSAVFQLKLKESAKALALLDKLASSNDAQGVVRKLDVAGGTFYTPDPEQGVLIGVVQDRFYVVMDATFASAQTRLEAAVNDIGKGLGSTAEWNDIKKHLIRDSNAIGYVDTTALRAIAEAEMDQDSRQEYDESFAPFIRPFKYVLLSSATQATKNGNLSRNHTGLFIGISK
ncbi:MAG: DUF3352 domain-containing protein [Chloroflexota bacterium]